MKIKHFTAALILIFVSTITLPVFAAAPQSRADCQRIHAGDDAAIQACIDGLNK